LPGAPERLLDREAALDVAEDQQGEQRRQNGDDQRGPRASQHGVRGQRHETARDIGQRTRYRAHPSPRRSGLSTRSSNFIMNSTQRRRSLPIAWATVVTVVSGSPYERKMLATSSISTSGRLKVSRSSLAY